ncbi:tetraacyldisaccharide 4'-kinase, partial [uncultured Parasutterella sp.]
MNVQLETLLHKQWDKRGIISWLLLPASAVFMWASSRRRKNAKVTNVGVPVVVVGNIYVGGTGKTPVTISLVRALRERGWNPGVISRGYKGAA